MGLAIVVGTDTAGVNYKETLKADLKADACVVEATDVGVRPGEDIDYPHVAVGMTWKVTIDEVDRALLMCGTRMGMATAADRVPGICALVTHGSFSVERLALPNDTQIPAPGECATGLQLTRRLAHEWFGHTSDPESSSNLRVTAIRSYESDLH